VVLYAFDLNEHDGDDLRGLPLLHRKRRLARLFGRGQRRAIRFVEHMKADGQTIFHHVCRMGLEGIVSKRTDAPAKWLGKHLKSSKCRSAWRSTCICAPPASRRKRRSR
jgi:bifunctional non-homologous end joining protein LigD